MPKVCQAVEVHSLSHQYGQREALAGVSFHVAAGEIFALLGPNGGGKTTLFRVLCTSLRSTGGQAAIEGLDVVAERGRVREISGVVFQHPSLDRKLTVRENLRHQGRLYGMSGRLLEDAIDDVLTRFGIADRAADRVETLSGGLARRADLAKGLLHRPRVLLLDEPSTGLDPQARWELWQFLDQIRRASRLTVLMTTHFMDEADRCDRVGIIDQGRLVAEGSPAELKSRLAGECLHIESDNVKLLADDLQARFGLAARIVGGSLRLEHPRGHELVPRLVEAFPEQIRSVAFSRPTLEEVFIHYTGRRFSETAEGRG